MTISDSNPVQLWLSSENTFNETDVCGLTKQDCFCQPWQCDDDIIIQVQNSNAILLAAYDQDNILLSEADFIQISTGIWQSTFQPDISPSICNKLIQLKIFEYNGFLLNPSFNDNSVWTNEATGMSWAVGTGTASVFVIGGPGTFSTELTQVFSVRPAGSYRIILNRTLVNFSAFAINLRNGASSVSVSGLSTTSGTHDFTASSPFDRIVIKLTSLNAVSATATIQDVQLYEIVEVAKSDCLDMKTSQLCTKLISYTNSSDFDGIDYETAPLTLYIRIPATFYEESNPQEQEDLELSNGQIVTIRQGIQQKKKLDIGYMPPYMHLKVQKILMHETVTIDGTQWRRRDPYNAPNIPKYNLKKGDVLLTKYNSVEKNTI